jgi:hypothetical protein
MHPPACLAEPLKRINLKKDLMSIQNRKVSIKEYNEESFYIF